MVDAVVGFAATPAQDSHAVDDDVDAFEQRIPRIGRRHPLEPYPAALAALRVSRQAVGSALGSPGADHDRVSTVDQRRDDMPSEEPRSAQHQDAHDFPLFLS
jgi:hypothetical protein